MHFMKRLRLTIVLLVLVLLPAGGITYLLGAPRLISVTPQANAEEVAVLSSLRLEFSRRMNANSVTDRLEIFPQQAGGFTWDERGRTMIFTPSETWPSGETVQVRLLRGAYASGFLPFSIREEASWSFTIAQPRLIYLYPSEGPPNLYLLNPIDRNTRQLTNYLEGVADFDVDSQGSVIYYTVEVPDGSLIYAIQDLNLDDSQDQTMPTPILALDCRQARCSSPRLAPDGSYLAYERSAFTTLDEPSFPQVWVLPLDQGLPVDDGAEPRLIDQSDHQTIQPQWSPDGLLLVYDTIAAAYTVRDLAGTEIARFPNTTGYPGSWDPSGEFFIAPEIFYESALPSEPDTVGVSYLIRYSLLDGSTQILSEKDNLEDAFPAFAPSGAKLAFTRKYLDTTRWTPGRQVWLMDSNGENARPINNESVYNHFDFTWSPDERLLVYVRFHQTELTQAPEIWIYDMSIQNAWRLLRGGYAPQWIP